MRCRPCRSPPPAPTGCGSAGRRRRHRPPRTVAAGTRTAAPFAPRAAPVGAPARRRAESRAPVAPGTSLPCEEAGHPLLLTLVDDARRAEIVDELAEGGEGVERDPCCGKIRARGTVTLDEHDQILNHKPRRAQRCGGFGSARTTGDHTVDEYDPVPGPPHPPPPGPA